jgi:hypothetical protein
MTIFWDVAPYSLVEVYWRFRGACCLHHQGSDEGSKYLWSVGKLLPDYIFILAAVRTWNLTKIIMSIQRLYIGLLGWTRQESLYWNKKRACDHISHPIRYCNRTNLFYEIRNFIYEMEQSLYYSHRAWTILSVGSGKTPKHGFSAWTNRIPTWIEARGGR